MALHVYNYLNIRKWSYFSNMLRIIWFTYRNSYIGSTINNSYKYFNILYNQEEKTFRRVRIFSFGALFNPQQKVTTPLAIRYRKSNGSNALNTLHLTLYSTICCGNILMFLDCIRKIYIAPA